MDRSRTALIAVTIANHLVDGIRRLRYWLVTQRNCWSTLGFKHLSLLTIKDTSVEVVYLTVFNRGGLFYFITYLQHCCSGNPIRLEGSRHFFSELGYMKLESRVF